MSWDLFISHASEDKNDFVRPLAEALKVAGMEVWYDESTLRIGDSLRKSIDDGLARCRYGVVVLSPSFFEKKWPQLELDGLIAREDDIAQRILPVWHNVSFDEVRQFSPMLAGRFAASSSHGLNHVVSEILKKACLFRITDHHGQRHWIDVCACTSHQSPIVPWYLKDDPARLCSPWLVERLLTHVPLRLHFDPNWAGGTWLVVDLLGGDGEVLNLDQVGDLMPPKATTTTTTTPNPDRSG